MKFRQQHIYNLGFFLLPLLLTLALYWPTLTQPYFWDDVPHFHFATTRTLQQIWTDVRGLSYYRPLTFTLYKAFFVSLPVGNSTLPHIFLLLVHTANGWLIGALTRRLLARLPDGDNGWTPALGGLLAALLFVVYPFAVLPVAHFAAMMHPLMTLFTLGASLSALQFAACRRACWLVLALILAAAAPFVHESGAMAGAVAAAVLLLAEWPLARRDWMRLVALACASAVFLLIWWFVPKTPNAFEWIGWGGVLASATFFAQGPSFPLQFLARPALSWLAQRSAPTAWTVVGLPWWTLGVIWAVALAALVLAGLVLWRARRLRFLAIALAWPALAALPSIVVLPFPYISVSQRLLYSGGPAAALLWATVCVSAAERLRRPIWRTVLAVGLATLIAVPPALYIQREMALHELALRPLEQLAQIARQYPDERHLIVNPPNWVNYKEARYALGQEGVSISADYVDFKPLVELNANLRARFTAVTIPQIRAEMAQHHYSTIGEETPWDWAEFAAQAHRYHHVWVTHYGSESISIQEAGSLRMNTDPPDSLAAIASFDNQILLLDQRVEPTDSGAALHLWWSVQQVPTQDVTVFAHVYDQSGQLVSQADGYPLLGLFPPASWQPGDQVYDIRYFTLPDGLEGGQYRIVVGWYDTATGERLPARDRRGQPVQDNAFQVFPP